MSSSLPASSFQFWGLSDFYTTLLTALGVILIGYFIWLFIGIYSQCSKLGHIPGTWQVWFAPFRIPFFAPYLYLGSMGSIPQLAQMMGDAETQTLRISLAQRSIIWVSDPEMLKELLVTKANNFSKPKQIYEVLNPFDKGNNVLTAPHTEEWKKHFKICSPGFSSKNLEYMCKIAVESTDLMFKKWDEKLQQCSQFVLNVGDYSDITLDVLGKAGFGVDFGIFSSNEEGRQLRQTMDIIMRRGMILKRFVRHLPLLYKILSNWSGATQALETCSKILDKIINQRREEVKNRTSSDVDDGKNDILSLLVEANTIENLLTDDELKSNAFILTLAGHETTSTLLQWTTFELSKRPEILKKLQTEVTRVLNGRNPTYDDYNSLEYVNAVIMELAKKDTTLGKYQIPKGSFINAFILNVHKKESIWKNADEFDPERFKDAETRDRVQHDFTWMPFSMGNRKCIGYRFSLLEACMILTKLVQKYDFVLLNDEEKDPVGCSVRVVQRPTNLKVRVSKREH
ncbi:hypothetical protein C9374_008893 [Naegleria lovaniensis]|uniref:Cytochrome P450 n=1 Tax=Naegleria lovaniensis TaxID=51637 RepID=A0AA88GFW7_NAELO|nr:uncharacterized protein C9374_008893 [Naegleria lovaniensis]KAG2377808.1 hypothetical protein C9374_008893 [Naegleria lovaniensis]